jgi:hypothetical protein
MTYDFEKHLNEIEEAEKKITLIHRQMNYLQNVNNPNLSHMKMNFFEILIFEYFWLQCYWGLSHKLEPLKEEIRTMKHIYNYKGLLTKNEYFLFLKY